jgi:SAM-dependent methyltransferase
VLKYHQLLDEVLDLDGPARALVTVLLLRGPQTAGELRARTERLHTFGDKEQVETALRAMSARQLPLVRELPRAAGHKDTRWVHLLGPVPTPHTAAAAPAVDRDAILIDGVAARDARVVAGYDEVAGAYAEQLVDELSNKPFDRWLLDQVARLARRRPVVDAGCGPGHVAGYLAERGADVVGIDISPGMIVEARERFGHIEFEQADLTRLLKPRTAPGWGAVLAWYSLVHLAGSEVEGAVAALARVLDHNGWLALAVHLGDEVRRVDTLCGRAVELDFVLHDRDQVLAAVRAAGLVDVEWYVRGPYEAVEAQTERLYVLARRPD